MRLKMQNKGIKLLILIDAIIYTGLFLIGEPLKWFKFYFLEY